MPFRVLLDDMDIPDVEIVLPQVHTWARGKVKWENWTEAQKAVFGRLNFSCAACPFVLTE